MRAGEIAKPQRVDSNLLLFPLTVFMAANDKFRARADGGNAACQRQRRAAWDIKFLVVVHFDNFNVRIWEHSGRTACNVSQHCNAERIVGGKEYRNLGGGRLDLRTLRFRLTGRGDEQRKPACETIVDQRTGGAVMREIDHAVGRSLIFSQCPPAAVSACGISWTDACSDLVSGSCTDQLTHAAGSTVYNNLHLAPFLIHSALARAYTTEGSRGAQAPSSSAADADNSHRSRARPSQP